MADKKTNKKVNVKKVSPVEKNSVQGKKPDKTMAIVGLVINFLIWPGLGTLIAGRIGIGITQMVLYAAGGGLLFVGILLIFLLIGIPIAIIGALLMFAMWLWSLIYMVKMIKAAD